MKHIYLMERKTRKDPKTPRGKREVKIGESKHPPTRLNGSGQVNDSIPGKVILLDSWPCHDVRKLEKQLHVYFKPYRFVPKDAGKGGGKTEWFRLTSGQIKECKGLIRMHIRGASSSNGELISMTIFWSLVMLLAFVFLLNFSSL